MKGIKKNVSGVEREFSEEELREEEMEEITGGFGEFEGLQVGELISTPLKEKVKGQETLTDMTLDFVNQSKLPH